MRSATLAYAAALSVAFVARAARADVGPVKHWAAFPGGEVRAVSMRGERFGGENRYTALQGRDGRIYVRGRLYLFRVLDDEGRNEPVADTSQCSGWAESQGADEGARVPRAICTRAAEIIIAAARWHRHIRVPQPDWSGAFTRQGGYRLDNRYLTSVVPAAGGGYWFGFAVPGAVGRVWPSGRAELRAVPGLGKVKTIVVVGDNVYVADDRCQVGHLRRFALVDLHRYNCSPFAYRPALAQTSDGAVWILNSGDGFVERYRLDGARARWRLGVVPISVAVARNGTAYVLALTANSPGHPMLAVIARGRAPQVRVLPMLNAETIAVDGRDRVWISDPFDHAFAVVTPKGARQ